MTPPSAIVLRGLVRRLGSYEPDLVDNIRYFLVNAYRDEVDFIQHHFVDEIAMFRTLWHVFHFYFCVTRADPITRLIHDSIERGTDNFVHWVAYRILQRHNVYNKRHVVRVPSSPFDVKKAAPFLVRIKEAAGHWETISWPNTSFNDTKRKTMEETLHAMMERHKSHNEIEIKYRSAVCDLFQSNAISDPYQYPSMSYEENCMLQGFKRSLLRLNSILLIVP